MFEAVVTQIGMSWFPKNFKVPLVYSIVDLIEMHIHGLGLFLFNFLGSNAHYCGIFNLDRGGRLRVMNFNDGSSKENWLFPVEEEGTILSFRYGGHNIAHYFTKYMNETIEFGGKFS